MIINLAFFYEIATHPTGARNDRIAKGFRFLNRNLGPYHFVDRPQDKGLD